MKPKHKKKNTDDTEAKAEHERNQNQIHMNKYIKISITKYQNNNPITSEILIAQEEKFKQVLEILELNTKQTNTSLPNILIYKNCMKIN
ncbi:hypothetical protein, partial [Acinetobacter baumannii]|uniref:hypothetical protein n=1 Tax=Acinetobacter baumannii TaxID=470 RepID=UPI001CA6CA59